MQSIVLVVHVLLAMGLIGLILIQHGKGADAGAAFGSGASASVFGAQGSGSFLTRLTAILATLFFSTSLFLAYLSGQMLEVKSVAETLVPTIVAPKPGTVTAPSDVPVADGVIPPPAPPVVEPPQTVAPVVPSVPVVETVQPEPKAVPEVVPAPEVPVATTPPTPPVVAPEAIVPAPVEVVPAPVEVVPAPVTEAIKTTTETTTETLIPEPPKVAP